MWSFKVQTRSSLCIAAVYAPQPRAIVDCSGNLCQNLTRHSYIDIYILTFARSTPQGKSCPLLRAHFLGEEVGAMDPIMVVIALAFIAIFVINNRD